MSHNLMDNFLLYSKFNDDKKEGIGEQIRVLHSSYQNMIEIILFFGQHINCKSIAQPSLESVLVTSMAFPF